MFTCGRRDEENGKSRMQRMVEEISEKDFGKPFMHKAISTPRLRTTGGRYLLRSHNIDINRKYLEQLGDTRINRYY